MKTVFAAPVLAVALLALAASDASAWTCRAVGLGVSTKARAWSIVDAKLIALRRCERRAAAPICTILWCRPR